VPTLAALVDDNLLVAAPDGRFRMLELVRELAEEELAASEEDAAVPRRHAEHYRALAEEARQFARGPEEKAWLDRLVLELDNLRVALRWSIDADPGLGLALVEALEPLWVRGPRQREGLHWVELLLEAPHNAPPDVHAGALTLAGRLAGAVIRRAGDGKTGDTHRARRWHEQALTLARAAGDDRRAAWALHGLGDVALHDGDLEAAQERFEESLALFISLGDLGPAGGRLSYLATVATARGNLDAARDYWERCRASYEAAGDALGVAGAIHGLGDHALATGELDRALAHYAEALERAVELDADFDCTYCLAGIAAGLAAQGRRDDAARMWGAVERLDAALDVGITPDDRAGYERRLGSLDPGAVAAGRELSLADAIELARALVTA
jgi:tetratricopeptide (TPR) repeat protein